MAIQKYDFEFEDIHPSRVAERAPALAAFF
jgi:hypothetical protein